MAARLVLLLSVGVVTPAGATVWYVDGAAPGGDGLSWSTAFQSPAVALSAASAGDEIWVAAGTYTPSPTDATLSFVLASGISLYGGFAGNELARDERDWINNVTVLSGDIGHDDTFNGIAWEQVGHNSGHVLDGSNTDRSCIVDGFTISQGGTGPPGTPAGSPLMVGSGLYLWNGSATVRNCRFLSNHAAFGPGGAVHIYDGDPEFANCRFEYNSVHLSDGGALYSGGTSQPDVHDCLFLGNWITFDQSDAGGGAWYHGGSRPITVTRCRFENNRVRPFFSIGGVGYGGGLMSFLSGCTVANCEFRANQASIGGGMITWGPTLVMNSVFAGNAAIEQPGGSQPDQGGEGGGFVAYAAQSHSMRLVNCTLASNDANKFGGVFGGWNATAVLENCIVWQNHGSNADVAGCSHEEIGGNFDLAYCDVRYIFGPPEIGEDPPDPDAYPTCIDVDPLFASFAAGDFQLRTGSPVIDAGDTTAYPAGHPTDLAGAPRLSDDPETVDTGVGGPPVIDLGAYEYSGAACSTFAEFEGCFVSGAAPPPCICFDIDDDGTITIADFATFQRDFTGG